MATYGPEVPGPGGAMQQGGALQMLGSLFNQDKPATFEQKKKRRQRLADRLATSASDTSPTDMWGGINRIGEGMLAGRMNALANKPDASANAFMPKKGFF